MVKISPKAHKHAADATDQYSQGIGNNIKIHLVVDSCDNPIGFILTSGEVYDSKTIPELLILLPNRERIIADRGHDCRALLEFILTTKWF
ncbi:transposase [Pasteurella multocida]